MDNTQKFDGFPVTDIGMLFENMFRKLYGNGHPCGKNPQSISLNLFWITGFPMTVIDQTCLEAAISNHHSYFGCHQSIENCT